MMLKGNRNSNRLQGIQLGFVPENATTRPIRHQHLAIGDLERLLQDRVGPIHVFNPMCRRRRAQKLRADYRHQVRRHLDTLRRGDARGLHPARRAADPRDVRHDEVAGAENERSTIIIAGIYDQSRLKHTVSVREEIGLFAEVRRK